MLLNVTGVDLANSIDCDASFWACKYELTLIVDDVVPSNHIFPINPVIEISNDNCVVGTAS